MEDLPSCFFLYKAALVFAIIRWALSWASKLRQPHRRTTTDPHFIRRCLPLATYSDVAARHAHCGGQADPDTCAVCLSQLREADEVRQLRNCSHVFHRDCIDRWIDHDRSSDDPDLNGGDHDVGDEISNHRSCPLCRAPLLTPSQLVDRCAQPDPEPSWAVERILYLFGDDLLC